MFPRHEDVIAAAKMSRATLWLTLAVSGALLVGASALMLAQPGLWLVPLLVALLMLTTWAVRGLIEKRRQRQDAGRFAGQGS